MIDLSDVCRNSSFDQWFSVFFIIHLANLRSVKIVQKSVKSQVIFQLLMSGIPGLAKPILTEPMHLLRTSQNCGAQILGLAKSIF